MKSLKWVFCALAISAGAYYSIGSSNTIVGDNIEALTSGDANVTFVEHDAYQRCSWGYETNFVKFPSGYCDEDFYYPYSLDGKCIDIEVRP